MILTSTSKEAGFVMNECCAKVIRAKDVFSTIVGLLCYSGLLLIFFSISQPFFLWHVQIIFILYHFSLQSVLPAML